MSYIVGFRAAGTKTSDLTDRRVPGSCPCSKREMLKRRQARLSCLVLLRSGVGDADITVSSSVITLKSVVARSLPDLTKGRRPPLEYRLCRTCPR